MLLLRDIFHSFGSTPALTGVSFDVRAGEVHALLGENGAGKSTLMRIAAGLLRADAGHIEATGADGVERHERGFRSVAAARRAGIGLVHQHFSSIDAFTVGENVALAAGWHDTGPHAAARATALGARLGLPLDGAVRAGELSAQMRQRLEIVKALAADATILLLDEPTAVLAPPEVEELMVVVRRVARDGGAVVLITHKLDEVFTVADRVTVLRRGIVTHTGMAAQETPLTLARAMIGGDLPAAAARAGRADGVLVRARGWQASANAPALSFDIQGGLITGIAAVEGNGQRQLLRAIAGVDPHGSELQVDGPVAFIPEDRTTEGLVAEFSIAENMLLGTMAPAARWIRWRDVGERTRRMMAEFDVRAPGPDVAVASLSGGNQQKVVFARALAGAPQVIVAENPTRGLDVQATLAIHGHLRQAAARGAAVIVHSSDLDEVMELADELYVMARGQFAAMPSMVTRGAVGDAMLGVAGSM